MKNIKICLTIVAIYLFLAIVFNYKVILLMFDSNYILMIPENTAISVDNYLKIFIGTYTWNDTLSQPSWGFDFLSYRIFFWIIGSVLNMTMTQLVILEKIAISFLAFFGAFILSEDYLYRTFENRYYVPIASAISGLFYGLNPSFMIGDAFWMSIQFSYVSFPWIVWTFNKIILDKNIKYAILCALILVLNVDEHFIWAGFPLFLGIYSAFIFIVKSFKKKGVDIYPMLSFVLTISIFVGMVAYRLMIRLATTTPYQLMLTKSGVDIPWTQATFFNMIRAMTHMDLPRIYGENLILTYVTLSIPVLAISTILWYRKNWIIIFYGFMILLQILTFDNESPFKQLHYWIFFDTPFGPAFRTWRIADAIIALSLTVMMAFSIYYIVQRLYKKNINVLITILGIIIFILFIYSWPLVTGKNIEDSIVKVPNEYFYARSFLSNQTGDFRAIYIPEFTYSLGKYSNLRPFWSNDTGAIQEFLTFSFPIRSFWPTGNWGHFYNFALSPLYYSLLRNGDIDTLAYFMKWTNIKYIVIHDDVFQIRKDIENQINFLNSSTNFKLVFHNGTIYIFENKVSEKNVEISQVALVDGGYRVIEKFYNVIHSNQTYSFIFVDQKDSAKLYNVSGTIITDKSKDQLIDDLTFFKIIDQSNDYALYPYRYVTEHDVKNKWSRSSYLDVHQQVWHPYVNWRDYAWDNDYMKGVVLTDNSKDTFNIPFRLENSGKYVLFLRYFANENGGTISIKIRNDTSKVKTINDYNGFFLYKYSIDLKKGTNDIYLENIKGFNAISAILLIPEDVYKRNIEDIRNYTSSLSIIDLGQNIVENPSFENNMYGWKMDDSIESEENFNIMLDNSTLFDGDYSLQVSTNNAKKWYGWSWIRSNWINVTTGDEYGIVTNMKGRNVDAPHIVIEGYDWSTKKSLQLLQVPSAQYGSFDWKMYKDKLAISDNITKIRINLNAGRSDNNKTATTWFDYIKIIPLRYNKIDKLENKKIESKIPSTTAPIIMSTGREVAIKTDKRRGFIPINQPPGNVIEINEYDNVTWFNEDVIPVTFVSDVPEFGVIFLDYGKRTSYMFIRQGSYHFYFKENKNFNITVIVKSLYRTSDNDTNINSSIDDTNEKLKDIFTVKEIPAKITNYTKINPTLYDIKINATKPFMLSFAESYDPLWTVKIDIINGKPVKSEVVRPIPLYSVVNGFWINQTGDLDITIEYGLQRQFYIGIGVSITTLIICIGYLLYDWRRKRNEQS